MPLSAATSLIASRRFGSEDARGCCFAMAIGFRPLVAACVLLLVSLGADVVRAGFLRRHQLENEMGGSDFGERNVVAGAAVLNLNRRVFVVAVRSGNISGN